MIYDAICMTNTITDLVILRGRCNLLWAFWFFCLVVDHYTGTAVACKTGKWSSKAALAGILGKLGRISIVLVTVALDFVLRLTINDLYWLPFTYTALLSPIVLVWYILAEISSILENAEQLGAKLPPFLMRWIAALQKRIRQTGSIATPPLDKDE